MTDTNVIKLAQPGTFTDSLTEILRTGARALLTQAIETEVADFLGRYADLKTEAGHQRVVRHGHLPEREIMTGIGPVVVRQPRVRDREAVGGERVRFSPTILPPYARRTKSLEVLIPILYLKGISTGDFEEALAALLGKDAGGLSASTIGRLKDAWLDEHLRWSDRDLSAKRYVYFWADGIHVQARLENDAQCLLVIIGATPEGKKELVGLIDGVRESAQSWKELLLDLKRRGLAMGPELVVADGALGFWKALPEVWPKTREQRCWVHKTANVLNKLPKSLQGKAKRALQNIWMAETKHAAEAALDMFVEIYGQGGRMSDQGSRKRQMYGSFQVANVRIDAHSRLRLSGRAKLILAKLIKDGDPLHGGPVKFNQGFLATVSDALETIANLDIATIEPSYLLTVAVSVFRLGRCHPWLRFILQTYEDRFARKIESDEFEAVSKEIKDEVSILKCGSLYARNMHHNTRFVHGDNFTERLDPEGALSRNLPNLGLHFISLKAAQLCAQGDYEGVLNEYDIVAKPIIEKYGASSRLETSELWFADTSDLDVRTCIGHVYTNVATAYIALAAQQYGISRKLKLDLATQFLDSAERLFLAVDPPWIHGLANLNANRYVLERAFGRWENAQKYRERFIVQSAYTNDVRRQAAFRSVIESDRDSLLRFICSN